MDHEDFGRIVITTARQISEDICRDLPTLTFSEIEEMRRIFDENFELKMLQQDGFAEPVKLVFIRHVP